MGAILSAMVIGAAVAPHPVQAQASPYEELVCSYDWDCQKAIRVMDCESSGRAGAYNAGQYGLFQIAYRYHKDLVESPTDLYDPSVNVLVAYEIWSAQGWGPWPVCGRR